MAGSVRYCILCGREIGEEMYCSNPDCGKIPNFYRDIPGPKHGHASAKRSARPESTGPLVGPATRSAPVVAENLDRMTMPLQAAPVAVLCGVSDKQEEYPICPGHTEIGARRPAKIVIDRDEISSRHAKIVCVQREGGQWRLGIIDHGSTNGTFVNGERVKKKALKPGDRISFATREYELRVPAADGPRVTMQI